MIDILPLDTCTTQFTQSVDLEQFEVAAFGTSEGVIQPIPKLRGLLVDQEEDDGLLMLINGGQKSISEWLHVLDFIFMPGQALHQAQNLILHQIMLRFFQQVTLV